MSDGSLPHARGGRPQLIDGIYNYCDSRCPRCKFTARCLTYLFQEGLKRAGPEVAAEQMFEAIAGPPPDQPTDVKEFIADVEAHALSMTAEERAGSDREHDQHVRSVADDRLVVAARGYAMSTWNITHALQPIVHARGDPVVIEAVESIAELAGPIASKVSRAASASLYREELDSAEFEDDANGSAKVARLAVNESRQAWQMLTENDRGTADGVPAAMLRVLDEIDAQLADRFPSAMAFVRPGFDTDDPP